MQSRPRKEKAKTEKRINDSLSLWNNTLSPGWTNSEIEKLKVGIMIFGVGNWKEIRSNLLPFKSKPQINLQTQRMLGQQSLKEFKGLKIDVDRVFADNQNKRGPNIIRKNNCIVNSGDRISRKELLIRRQKNKEKYGLTAAQVRDIKMPKNSQITYDCMSFEQLKMNQDNFSTVEQIHHLKKLRECAMQHLEYKKRCLLILNFERFEDPITKQESFKLIVPT
eukprot:TRINITY_DN3585_c0_g7_i2.p1 TRINITY_DN3585_c0_g7~~TRINITY_DN3585_c0_g7_i2.p1  ORF type:complete len:222 (+),score=56.14 TRINITY_DN3585_c0_g7_i2:128-793(+)